MLITGASGTGKTWLACAIGSSATRQKQSVRYFRTNEILREMKLADHNGTLAKLKKNLIPPTLVILDDFGIAAIDEKATEYLLDILDARTDIGSTIVVGQPAREEWHEYLGSSHMADAIIDRLVQRSHQLDLKGPSLREAIRLTIPSIERSNGLICERFPHGVILSDDIPIITD